jgi:hypothetical protein
VEKWWQKTSEQSALQTRGLAAIRDLLLLRKMLSSARHRVGRFLQDTDLSAGAKASGLFQLDSEAQTLRHCIDNAFGHWTDIVPAHDIIKQLEELDQDELQAVVAAMEVERASYQKQKEMIEEQSALQAQEAIREINRLSTLATETEASKKKLEETKRKLEADQAKSKRDIATLTLTLKQMDAEIERAMSSPRHRQRL